MCREFENLNFSNKNLLQQGFDFSFVQKIGLESYNKMINAWKNILENIVLQIENEKKFCENDNQKLFVKTTQPLENNLKTSLKQLQALQILK